MNIASGTSALQVTEQLNILEVSERQEREPGQKKYWKGWLENLPNEVRYIHL